MNLCSSCRRDFASVDAFDRHRVGTFDYTLAEGLRMELPRENGRRCLDLEELEQDGWQLDPRGRWINATALRNRPRAVPA